MIKFIGVSLSHRRMRSTYNYTTSSRADVSLRASFPSRGSNEKSRATAIIERTRKWQGRCFKVYGKECHQSKYFSASGKLLRLGNAEMKIC